MFTCRSLSSNIDSENRHATKIIDFGNVHEPEDLLVKENDDKLHSLTPPLAYEEKNKKYTTEKREKIGRGKYRLSRNTYSIHECLEYLYDKLDMYLSI